MSKDARMSGRVSVDFDGETLVLQSPYGDASILRITEWESDLGLELEDWAEHHPEWLVDHAVGLVELYLEEETPLE